MVGAVFPLHQTLSHALNGWLATLPATGPCKPTSPLWRSTWSQLLADSAGQVLISLPGVAIIRAAGFAAHSLPINRYPDAEHLYSATGLAPALYESATVHRRGRISRQGLAEHRDALMGIAWGHSRYSPTFAERDRQYRSRGMTPSRPGSPWPGTPAAWPTDS